MRTRPFVAVALTSIVAFSCVTSSSTPQRDAGVPDAAGFDAEGPGLDAAITDAAEGAAPDAATSDAAVVDAADAAPALALSPLTPTAKGCSTDTVTFTASGGTPPYVWSTSEGGTTNLTVTSPTQVEWHDGSDNFCGVAGTVTITVTDSLNAKAATTMMVTAG